MEAPRQSVSDRASDAGGQMPGSSADTPLVNKDGKPVVRDVSDIEDYDVKC